jgi:hypothetical protein
VNFPFLNPEVHPIIGNNPGKHLGNINHLNNGAWHFRLLWKKSWNKNSSGAVSKYQILKPAFKKRGLADSSSPALPENRKSQFQNDRF